MVVRMMRGMLWGRPRWTWALDVAVIVLFAVVFASADSDVIKLIAIAAIVLRIVTALIPVAVWRLRNRQVERRGR